jgi:hypothetical protein
MLGSYGRLGNMCFEIAATVALALRNNDTYIFPNWEYKEHFNLNNCFATSISNVHSYVEPHFHYSPIPYRPNTDIRGFFQSELYFKDYQDTIRQLLTPKIALGTKYDYTSIHVRKGDYVNQPNNYVQLGMDYYRVAMELTKTKYYIIVSDDINWCHNNFIGEQFIFSENRSPVEDLALQIECEHNIIGNSSFSWWGAWLNKNPSKMVIAPNRWFGPNQPHNTKDLLPNEWICI